ncbi:PAS domain-containing protein [Thermoflavifilum thermophilum]|uniref:PAS fold-containing protein n=1 Tax=Thermoflavifilum thermophilum TaxID=1393122 RepID=A0A1I7N0B1_9BACT|nr:PAS fold-containing protein [Thermoflavifilum thermophilum]
MKPDTEISSSIHSWLQVLNRIPALVYISHNLLKTICWCNAFMERQTGYTLSEISKMGPDFFRCVMHPDDFHLAYEAQRYFERGGRMFTGCCRIRFKNVKQWEWFYGTALPFPGNKKSHLILCVFVQIPHQTHTLHQLIQMFKDILQYNHRSLLGVLTNREHDQLDLDSLISLLYLCC